MPNVHQVSSPAQGAVVWTRMMCSSAERLGVGMGRVMRERVFGSGSWKRATVVLLKVFGVAMLAAEVMVRKLVANGDGESSLEIVLLVGKEAFETRVLVTRRKQSIA